MDQHTYGFSLQDAKALASTIGITSGKSGQESPPITGPAGRIFKTPVGGIPKRVGEECGSAVCDEYLIDDAGFLVPASNAETIYSIFGGDDIGGNAYITVKLVAGKLVVDAEDCS